MPLKYTHDGTIYNVYYYPSIFDLDGPGVSQDHRIAVRVNGVTKYIGLSEDLEHEVASHLRIRIGGTKYAVLSHSKHVEGEIEDE